MKKYSNRKTILIDKKIVKNLLIGVICGITAIILLTLICSLVITVSGLYLKDSMKYVALSITGVGTFISGYICARLNKSNGLIIGIVTGLTVFVILLIISLCKTTQTPSIFTLYKLLVSMLFAGLGGIFGVNKKNKIKL